MTGFSPDRAAVLRLVEAAIRAPSADNQHHLRFTIDDEGLDVLVDESFRACHEPHRSLLTLLSFGAAIENLRLRLTQDGWTFVPAWFPDGRIGERLLRIRWAALEAAVPDLLAARITTRHTNRRLFRGPRISDDVLATVGAAVPRSDATALVWFDDKKRRRAVLDLMRIAEVARFQSVSLHAELFDSIDFTAGWKQSVAEHLAPATLEVEFPMKGLFAALRHPGVMRVARAFGAHHLVGLRAGYVPAATAPHLGAIFSTLPADNAALAVGAAFQRVWLAADAAGLALQPMVASAILAWQGPTDDPVRVELQHRLRDGWNALLGSVPPLIVFRMGHAKPATAIAGRKPPETYLSDRRA
jgi:hypothetical protein